MHDKEYLAAITLLNQKRQKTFTEQIRRTEKYRLLCNHPDECPGEQEQQLLLELGRLDKHLYYNNFNFLLQIPENQRALFLREANRIMNRIETLVQAIDWGES